MISLVAVLISLASAIVSHLGLKETRHQTKIQQDTFEAFKAELNIKQARDICDIIIANTSRIKSEQNRWLLNLNLQNLGTNVASIDTVEIKCYLPDKFFGLGRSNEDSIVFFLNRPITFKELTVKYKKHHNIIVDRKIKENTIYEPLDKLFFSDIRLRKTGIMTIPLELGINTIDSEPLSKVLFYAKISIEYTDLIYDEKHSLEKIVSFQLREGFKIYQSFSNLLFEDNFDSISPRALEVLKDNISTITTNQFTGQSSYY